MMTSKGALPGDNFSPSCFSNAEKIEGPEESTGGAGTSGVTTPFRVTGPDRWYSRTNSMWTSNRSASPVLSTTGRSTLPGNILPASSDIVTPYQFSTVSDPLFVCWPLAPQYFGIGSPALGGIGGWGIFTA